jgi:hypothetical protein
MEVSPVFFLQPTAHVLSTKILSSSPPWGSASDGDGVKSGQFFAEQWVAERTGGEERVSIESHQSDAISIFFFNLTRTFL